MIEPRSRPCRETESRLNESPNRRLDPVAVPSVGLGGLGAFRALSSWDRCPRTPALRRLLFALATGLVLLVATPVTSHAATCAQGKVVGRNGTITLYQAHRGLFACAGSIRRRIAAWDTDFFGDYRLPTFVSQGWFVGVDLVASGHCADYSVLAVDVRTGRRWHLPAGTGTRDSPANGCTGTGTGRLQAIAGISGGPITWISGPGPGPSPASPPRYASYEVMLKLPGAKPRSIVYAEGVDPHVLRLDPTTLTWQQDGVEHTLALNG